LINRFILQALIDYLIYKIATFANSKICVLRECLWCFISFHKRFECFFHSYLSFKGISLCNRENFSNWFFKIQHFWNELSWLIQFTTNLIPFLINCLNQNLNYFINHCLLHPIKNLKICKNLILIIFRSKRKIFYHLFEWIGLGDPSVKVFKDKLFIKGLGIYINKIFGRKMEISNAFF